MQHPLAVQWLQGGALPLACKSWKLRQYSIFESLRIVLMVPLHHKLICQLSSGNLSLTVRSRVQSWYDHDTKALPRG